MSVAAFFTLWFDDRQNGERFCRKKALRNRVIGEIGGNRYLWPMACPCRMQIRPRFAGGCSRLILLLHSSISTIALRTLLSGFVLVTARGAHICHIWRVMGD